MVTSNLNKWLILLFTLCNFVALSSYAFEKDRALRAATLKYPPYEYLEDGEAKGIAVEIIREAVERTGVKQVNFEFFPWKRAIKFTKSGRSDILFNAGKNNERQQWGEYVKSPLIMQKYVLFKKKLAEIRINPNFNNVGSQSIVIRQGYLYGTGPFRQALDNNKFAFIIKSKSTKQSVELLLGGRIDLLVGDYLPVMHYIQQQGLSDKINVVQARQQNMVVLTWPTYILFSKKTVSSQYVDEVNAAMIQMIADGFIDHIYAKYGY